MTSWIVDSMMNNTDVHYIVHWSLVIIYLYMYNHLLTYTILTINIIYYTLDYTYIRSYD